MTAPDLSMAQISRRMLSAKAEQFTESVIREMTRLALKHRAVYLSQGVPDFAAPEEINEVVVFEPFYENYGPDAILSGATPRFVKLRTPDWSFDEKELSAAFGPHTKAIILNTPNNPTGKVFTRAELEFIRDLCVRWNAYCITDEIY